MNVTLLETRNKYDISQMEASKIAKIHLRTYRRYETDNQYGDEIKRETIITRINNHFLIDEENGLLTTDEIKTKLTDLFDNEYSGMINYCYLFGSYSKGTAKENSDVDLYVSTSLTGLKFVGLIERVRETLNKKIDLIRDSEIENNFDLTYEIFKTGIKIYC